MIPLGSSGGRTPAPQSSAALAPSGPAPTAFWRARLQLTAPGSIGTKTLAGLVFLRESLQLMLAVRRAPQVRVSAAARRSREFRRYLTLWCSLVPRPVMAVLELPSDAATYLRGRHRQALRTNVSRGLARQLHVRELLTPVERLTAAGRVSESRPAGYDKYLMNLAQDPPTGTRWFAVEQQSAYVALAAVCLAGLDSYLLLSLSDTAHADASDARYVLHAHIVKELIAVGVARLWADGPLTVAPGLQHFQKLTGFVYVRPYLGSRRRRHEIGGSVISPNDLGPRKVSDLHES